MTDDPRHVVLLTWLCLPCTFLLRPCHSVKREVAAVLARHLFGAEVTVMATVWCITLGCLKAGTPQWWTTKQCLACYSGLSMTAQRQMGQSSTSTVVFVCFQATLTAHAGDKVNRHQEGMDCVLK